jgi:hypothetical protein
MIVVMIIAIMVIMVMITINTTTSVSISNILRLKFESKATSYDQLIVTRCFFMSYQLISKFNAGILSDPGKGVNFTLLFLIFKKSKTSTDPNLAIKLTFL